MIRNKKIPTESDVIRRLQAGEIQFPPLMIRINENGRQNSPSLLSDVAVAASWGGRTFDFRLQYKSQSTPKIFQQALTQIDQRDRQGGLPLLVMPFISPERLAELETREISGIDLCGNGVVIVPGDLLVFRTGNQNEFPQSGSIKNIYRGKSSLVPRVFLSRPEYSEVNDIKREIEIRDGRISLSTISKALKTLADDLVVTRKSGATKLLQSKLLIDQLSKNYEPPTVARTLTVRTREESNELLSRMFTELPKSKNRLVLTGVSSVSRYAVMAREAKVAVYCEDIAKLMDRYGEELSEVSTFPDLELIETTSDFVYFDPQTANGVGYSSPIQCYLELMSGDKRDRETADQVRERILENLPDL